MEKFKHKKALVPITPPFPTPNQQKRKKRANFWFPFGNPQNSLVIKRCILCSAQTLPSSFLFHSVWKGKGEVILGRYFYTTQYCSIQQPVKCDCFQSSYMHALFPYFPKVSPKCQFNTLLLIQSQSSQNKSVQIEKINKLLFFTVSVLLMLGNVLESIRLWGFCGSWLAGKGLPGMPISPISTHNMAAYQECVWYIVKSSASFVMLGISMTCSIFWSDNILLKH